VAAFFYRIFISAVIIFFVAGQFFIIGVLVAIWAVYLFLISPLIRNIRYFLNNPMRQKRKLRLFFILGTLSFVLVYGLFLLPVPFWSNVEGVIWPPEQSQVRVGTSGFCEELLVKPGDQVATGEPLLVLKDELLETQFRVLQYQLKELEAKYRYTAFWQKDRVATRMLREQIETVEADIAKHEEQMKRLVVRSPQVGQVYIPNADQLLGRFLQQGELVAYVVEPPVNIIRAVVQQKDIALVRDQEVSVEVRLAERLWQIYPAVITQAVPKASDYLPSRALGTAGGGSIPIEPSDEKGLRAYEPIFQFEIHLPDDVPISRIGGRAYLRFYHREEPLASQWYRSIRQLFLRHFDI
jgi:putative peptide zinc metalloprotease protein